MNILLITAIKPYKGSGSGLTEYAYQLINHIKPTLKREDTIEELYTLDSAKRNDIWGLLEVNTRFKNKTKNIPKEKYDIIHITNQEIGFAAKIFKKSGNKAKIITTVHDLSRFEKGLHRGSAQKIYNKLVKSSTIDAIRYSDFLLCNSSQTYDTVTKRFGRIKNMKVVLHGTKEMLLKAPIKKSSHKTFNIGYIGALVKHKNVIFILNAAMYLRGNNYKFIIYGTGVDSKMLENYVGKNNLGNVSLMSYLQEEEKVKTYDSFDVFVFPSLYEGLGSPILEAQARGLPVIIYKRGMIPKEVRKYCFEAESPEHMAQIIQNIKENGYNEKVKKKATEYARGFTWEKTAKETVEVYKKALK